MLIEMLGTFFSSILSGGVTGILGVMVQRYADLQNKKLDRELSNDRYIHEEEMRRLDAEIMREEWAQRTRIAEIEAAGKVEVADSEAFAASFNEPSLYSAKVQPTRGQSWMLVILDFIRGIVRPGLTIYLCVVTTLIYMHAKTLAGSMTEAQAAELLKLVVGTILYLCTTCLLWWFGVRNKQPAPKQK